MSQAEQIAAEQHDAADSFEAIGAIVLRVVAEAERRMKAAKNKQAENTKGASE